MTMKFEGMPGLDMEVEVLSTAPPVILGDALLMEGTGYIQLEDASKILLEV